MSAPDMTAVSPTNDPTVSVVIPIYKSEEYLAETLESVFAQTFQDFEVVTVDDGSPDNSVEIIKQYSERYPGKIQYIHQENGGIASARNTGIKNAKGEFIAFLDADDLWSPKRLELAMEVFERTPEVALVHSDCNILLPDGEVKPTKRLDSKKPYGHIYEMLVLRQATVACLTATFRRSVCEKIGFMDENRICMGVDDRDFWVRLAKHYPVGFIPESLASWRYHDNNYSTNTEKMFDARLYVHNKLERSTIKDWVLYRRGLNIIYKETADKYLIREKYPLAIEKYLTALAAWPFNAWCYYGLLKSLLRVKSSRTSWKSDSSSE